MYLTFHFILIKFYRICLDVFVTYDDQRFLNICSINIWEEAVDLVSKYLTKNTYFDN